MRHPGPACLPLLVLLMAALGCSGGGSRSTPAASTSGALTIAEVYEKTLASLKAGHVDTDGDTIPDDIETGLLHTDPTKVDTDGDGIPDNVEVFGNKAWKAEDPLEDKNRNGVIAALDQDDDGDGANDGDLVDSDGDGIPDYLEFYGYTYEALTGKPKLWDGVDHSVPYFKTDPNQRSTDQDPFDDSTEISGLNMDVSVKSPGGLPMVPALPEIVVRMDGYRVTTLDEITFTESKSVTKETTWECQTEARDSRTTEHGWEVGYEATAGYSFPGWEASVTFHANYSGSISNTHETSTSNSKGGSVANAEEWSKARTTKPSEAAAIKLFLKVYNTGTACASNVVPTMTLRIGGHNVATFQPGETQVNLLEPGATYPSTPGVYWVVDTNQNGGKITLTIDELRALESGAPVTLTLTQMSADVMRKDAATGAYVSMGDWNEYAARCRAVCADLYFDTGDGNFTHSLVYAGNSPTSPRVTLGDAFLWAIGGFTTQGIGVNYRDLAGLSQQMDLANWTVCVDGGTYSANGLAKGAPLPAGTNIFDLRLNPSSVIFARAPRVNPDPQYPLLPDIYYAFYDSSLGSVSGVVSDYNGVAKVEFIDGAGNARAMAQDLPGSDFYVYYPLADLASYPDGYRFTGKEKIRVTNVKGMVAEQTLSGIYVVPVPTAPDIKWATVEKVTDSEGTSTSFLEAEVVPDPRTVLSRVELYYPFSGSYVAVPLDPVPDAYRRPNRWRAQLPAPAANLLTSSELVAFTKDGLYSTLGGARFQEVSPFHVGQTHLYAYYGWYWTDDWSSWAVDLDDSSIYAWGWEEGSVSADNYPMCQDTTMELWLVYNAFRGVAELRPRTGVTSYKLPSSVDYDSLTSQEAQLYAANLDVVSAYQVNSSNLGDVYLIKTSEQRLAKVKVVEYEEYDPSGAYNTGRRVKLKFSVFRKASDN